MHDRVIHWFHTHKRDLPWRNAGVTPWQILVSEVMLQQTPAARVAPAWLAWVERWPDARALANASTADVLRQWDRLGYPSRALRLQATARTLVDSHGGEVPADYEALVALPGVGDYTAAAVLAFAFHQSSVVLDTNVRRVLMRAFHGVERPGPTVSAQERELAQTHLPPRGSDAAVWSAALMELGATVCTMRAPQCGVCVLHQTCAWRTAGYPASELRRRTQRFEGTDRQVRGRIMAVLKSTIGSVASAALESVCSDAMQRERCIASLIEDGLVEQTRAGRYRLPQ